MVAMPVTFRLSKVVPPTTSRPAFASIDPLNVEIPDAKRFLVVMSSPIEAPPVTFTPPT